MHIYDAKSKAIETIYAVLVMIFFYLHSIVFNLKVLHFEWNVGMSWNRVVQVWKFILWNYHDGKVD